MKLFEDTIIINLSGIYKYVYQLLNEIGCVVLQIQRLIYEYVYYLFYEIVL